MSADLLDQSFRQSFNVQSRAPQPHSTSNASVGQSEMPNQLLDQRRLAELVRLRLLDTPPEEPFDRLTRLAARVLGAPVALVSLVDDHRQFFKSAFGLPEPWASRRETPLTHSFCQHVVVNAAPLRIEDARLHPLVCDNQAIPELGVIAYLGVPLTTPEGQTLGSLCVISGKPTRWTSNDQVTLGEIGASIMSEIALRRAHDDLLAANACLRQEATAREVTMRELRQREARLQAAQRLAHVGSFELHATPVPECHWSDEARRIMGLGISAPPSSIATFIAQVVHPDDRVRVSETLERATTARLATELEYRTRPVDGNCRTLITSIESAPGENGDTVAVCTAFDVTERYNTEAELAEYRNQLWHVARVATAGEMATVIAHELNQPLAAIAHTANACSRLSESGDLPADDLAQHLQTISGQAKRASGIIRQMRSYVRRQPATQQPLELDRVVDDILTMLAPMTRNLGIKLTRGCTAQLPSVLGDEIQLGQLVLNLVRNAYDAVETNAIGDRCVSVVTESFGDAGVRLQVTDNGPGIDGGLKDKIFEPFFTTRRDGLGMGLSIARTIAETHGALLHVGSKPASERGASFTVSFAAQPE